jgi:hypothetical protein
MDVNLRGMNLPTPRFRFAPIPEGLSKVCGFSSLQTFFPTMLKLSPLTKDQAETAWLDCKWRITHIDISGTSGPCSLELLENTDMSSNTLQSFRSKAFLKVTHLLHPVKWMKGKYSVPKQAGLPWHSKTWACASEKIQDPWNQAYVEVVASYALGRLREQGISPHFNEFYGAFCAKADTYRFNVTEDFGSFRNAKWFWDGQKQGFYKIRVFDTKHKELTNTAELEEYLREPSVIHSDEEDDTSEKSVEELEVDEALKDGEDFTLEEVYSIHSGRFSELSFTKKSENFSEDSGDPNIFYSEFKNYPVMLIAIEQNNGTMDELLDNIEEIGATHGTPEWELRWSAWIFQIIAGLSAAQAIFGFTHNDLHTNNIVWTRTEEEFFYYTLLSGAIFKVPTFGKLFRIIDYGRAIFKINETMFISDDFRPGNDAEGQYNFKATSANPTVILPNPSFDLSRLAISLFESLFPNPPEDLEGGKILSEEEGILVHETKSPLFNCLWGWMIDDNGSNILVNPDGSERFPDFDLYKHIAAYIHTAIPSQQFKHPAFDKFQVNPSKVGNVKKWQLFV